MGQPSPEQHFEPTATAEISCETIAYAEGTDPAYEARSAQEFTVRETPDGSMLLVGPCPRCRGAMEALIPAEVFLSSRTGLLARVLKRAEQHTRVAEDEDVQEVPLMCRCTGEHAGRPSDRKGCGAHWNLVIEDQK